MDRKALYFTISQERAREVIRFYEDHAVTALRIAEKLADEVEQAKRAGRPISKARFAAVCKWFGSGDLFLAIQR